VQILIHGNRIALQGSSPILPQVRKAGDEIQRCQQSSFAQEWKLELTHTGAITSLRLDLWNGHGYAVSDGSYKSGNGAAAWIIEGMTAANRLTGVCYTPGCTDDNSSFRSELAGLLGLLHVLTYWKPTIGKPQCCITCDGQLVINQLSAPQPIEPTEPHFDLLQVVRTLISTCSFTIHLHQGVRLCEWDVAL